jgi:hypothetical protein
VSVPPGLRGAGGSKGHKQQSSSTEASPTKKPSAAEQVGRPARRQTSSPFQRGAPLTRPLLLRWMLRSKSLARTPGGRGRGRGRGSGTHSSEFERAQVWDFARRISWRTDLHVAERDLVLCDVPVRLKVQHVSECLASRDRARCAGRAFLGSRIRVCALLSRSPRAILNEPSHR